jgi:hypothetical protein
VNYATILETYTFSEILELNDLTEADVLEYLVEKGFVDLPELLPLEFA